jgi:nucleoside-diphosphate-sugar epimerase
MSPKTALITGVNGITGSAVCEYLVRNTTRDQWEKIIVTSRSPLVLDVTDDRVEFVALDFSKAPTDLAQDMKEVCKSVTHAYFASYVHKNRLDELQAANKGLFENFLEALTQSAPKLENVLLYTGGKYYGAAVQAVPMPCRESAPRPMSAEDNFYYPQEDFLAAKQKSSNWTYNVVRPVGIIGFSPKPNGMNMAASLAVYLLLCKELGVEPRLATNQIFYNHLEDLSYAPIIADLSVYVSTHPNCKNEAFNVDNGDVVCWRYFWPRLAAHFGIHIDSDQEFSKPMPEIGATQQEFSFEEWFADKREVWDGLCEKMGVQSAKGMFDYVGGDLLDWSFRRTWVTPMSINKARRYGWTGWVDSYECMIKTWEKYAEKGLLPVEGGKGGKSA